MKMHYILRPVVPSRMNFALTMVFTIPMKKRIQYTNNYDCIAKYISICNILYLLYKFARTIWKK